MRMEADKSAWERIITKNRKLRADLRNLQGRYGFPMQVHALVVFVDSSRLRWMDFQRDIEAIMDKYKIPAAYRDGVRTEVMFGPEFPRVIPVGFPNGVMTRRADGTLEDKLIITSETDMDNPLVLDFITHMQAATEDPVPPPGQDPDNPRKLDWRPVLEWKLRHPDIACAEIDRRLGYGKDRTRKELAKLRNSPD